MYSSGTYLQILNAIIVVLEDGDIMTKERIKVKCTTRSPVSNGCMSLI